jgi:hypothetical protein
MNKKVDVALGLRYKRNEFQYYLPIVCSDN